MTEVPNHVSHDLRHEGIYQARLKFSLISSRLSYPRGIGSRTAVDTKIRGRPGPLVGPLNPQLFIRGPSQAQVV